MANERNVVVLISGRGSNMVNLIRCAANYRISSVISNKEDAAGLVSATELGIEAVAVRRKEYQTVADQKRAIFEEVRKRAPDVVALAGYMQIVEPYFVDYFRGRLINIHPALLPKFPGLDTHARAIAAGEQIHGCSVHFVDSGVDTGPIIAQASVPVMTEDTDHSLAERVLSEEHRLYPWVLNQLSLGRVLLRNDTVTYAREMLIEAAQLGFQIPSQEGRV